MIAALRRLLGTLWSYVTEWHDEREMRLRDNARLQAEYERIQRATYPGWTTRTTTITASNLTEAQLDRLMEKMDDLMDDADDVFKAMDAEIVRPASCEPKLDIDQIIKQERL